MLRPIASSRVYLALGYTDMRKSINGLSVIVETVFTLDPFSGQVFVFCNRRRNIVKVLYWDRNGFCIWQKRLEKHRFKWPVAGKELLEIDRRELNWLMDGLDISRLKGHGALSYNTLI